ncbi:MAG TPA: class I SAM-dependent methyltransferase [Polyangiaceae bacterium]|nr:class I SAM-dependent methyltransferase [Polyangiaceae bacterium]
MHPNAEAIQAWDGVLFEKFSRFRHILTTGLAGHSTEALRRHSPAEGARVLDLGCGFGDTTLEIAHAVGPAGSAVGVDAAVNFVEEATRGAREAGVKHARFFAADVQTEDLGGPYDLVFSRFGVMFFASPVAALRNVRRSLAPGGSILFVVWRKREDNLWMHAAEEAVKPILPAVSHDNPNEPTCGPGPFSMAGADVVSSQLVAAGFGHITLERFDTDICIGKDLDDAVAFALTIGPAGEMIRLAAAKGIDETPRVTAAIKAAIAPYQRPNGVFAPSSTWFVSAKPA